MDQVTEYQGKERRTGPEDRRDSTLKEYFQGFLVKLLENLASAKIWFFILPFIVSSLYMGWIIFSQVQFVRHVVEMAVKDKSVLDAINVTFKVTTDTFNSWCVFNVSLAGTIVVVRETFKVSKLKALNNSNNSNTTKEIKKMST